jgi:hypothetical protein
MAKANTFWRRLISRKQEGKGRIKNRRLPLDFECQWALKTSQ